ncbi:MAG: AgmX/PglI C-terminal domain-containing protein [Oligoflexia bacterium]|nr:AgmX/PglI C-terminal domain-containing protein [Oligoflexia bacterium]
MITILRTSTHTSTNTNINKVLSLVTIASLTIISILFTQSLSLATDNEKITMKRMNVDGNVYQDDSNNDNGDSSEVVSDPDDPELVGLDKELKKNSKMLKGFSQKSKKYGKLKVVVEKMAEKHLEFVEQKDEYTKVVDQFNKQIECQANPKADGCQNLQRSSSSNNNNRNGDVINSKNHSNPKINEMIILTVKKNLGLFQRCYQSELNNGTPFYGRVEFDFIIDEYGRVLTSSVINKNESIKLNRRFQDCLLSTMNSLTFPNSLLQKGEKIQVFQPINFYNKKR